MFASLLSIKYEDRVKGFGRFAVKHAKSLSRINCLCLKCCHSIVVNVHEFEDHSVTSQKYSIILYNRVIKLLILTRKINRKEISSHLQLSKITIK